MNTPGKSIPCFAALAVCAVLLAGCGGGSPDASGTEFDARAWKQGDGKVRARMAQNLVEKRTLVGKSKIGVISLLGKPDQASTESFAYFFDSGDADRPGSRYYVHVEFGPRGQRVKDAWITD